MVEQKPFTRTLIKLLSKQEPLFIEVFTTRLDTVFGIIYSVIAPEHPIIDKLKAQVLNIKEVEEYILEAKKKTELQRTAEEKDKTGVELKGIKAINPFNNEQIPIFVADYVLGHYGTGAVMAVPAHDARDFEFAKKYELEIREVIKSPDGKSSIEKAAFAVDGLLSNSREYDHMTSEEARMKMAAWLEKNDLGGKKIHYKLRDWCVSRQRYWGPPIPMIYCEKCGLCQCRRKICQFCCPKPKTICRGRTAWHHWRGMKSLLKPSVPFAAVRHEGKRMCLIRFWIHPGTFLDILRLAPLAQGKSLLIRKSHGVGCPLICI